MTGRIGHKPTRVRGGGSALRGEIYETFSNYTIA